MKPASAQTSVVVTGIGLFTGLGSEPEASWKALRGGRSAATWLDRGSDADGDRYAAYPFPRHMTRGWMPLSRAGTDAVNDAGIRRAGGPPNRDRIGTVVGFSKGNIRQLAWWNEHGLPDPAPFDSWHATWPGGLAGVFSKVWDFRGPCLAPIAACATGVLAAIRGAELIRQGLCDVVVTGAGDLPLEPFTLAAFRKMRAFARVEGDPSRAVRPWDKARSGFLPGEGAAVLVLEREEHARSRGVLPYAELAGGAFGSDAYHITDLNPDPANLAHVIGLALRDGEVQPSDLDYVNVHGTATRQNDPLECRAIRRALGPHADSVSCSANKAQIGHLLGAAGAAELAITCLAIRDRFVPPTMNLDDPDPACDLDGTPHVGKSREIRAALKISIGFGGHLAAAVLRRPDGPRRPPVPHE